MTKSELIAKIQKYEWNDIEFKKAQRGVSEDAYKTVSAYANTAGGYLVFGVQDSNGQLTIVGVIEVDKVLNDFLSALRTGDKLNRIICVNEEAIEYEDKTLLMFYVPESPKNEKPVYLRGDIRQSYIRRGASDEQCTREEIERFLRDSAQEPYDSVTVDIRADTFFDEETVNWYREIFQRRNPEHHSSDSHPDFLLNWNFVVEQREMLKPTRAGVLLFGKGRYVRQILPRPVLDYQRIDTRFESWSADKRWHDRVVFEENIFQTWRGLVAKYMRIAEHPFSIDPATLRRNDDPPDYVSFREAAINLLMHQDYGDYGRKPVIQFFTDCTIFWNPGDAFATEAELFDPTQKEVRNPAIVNALRRIGLSDQAGTGIRLISRNWQQLGNVPPVITNNKAKKTFELLLKKEQLLSEDQILFQSSIGVHLSEEEASVFAFACREGKISLTNIKAITGKTNRECRQLAERLQTQGLVKAIDDEHFELAEHLQARFRATEQDTANMSTPQSEQVEPEMINLSSHQSEQVLTVTDEHYKILVLCDVPRALKELRETAGFGSRGYFKANIIDPLLKLGLLQMTVPDKPRSSKQKYRLTENGLRLVSLRKKTRE